MQARAWAWAWAYWHIHSRLYAKSFGHARARESMRELVHANVEHVSVFVPATRDRWRAARRACRDQASNG
eukprot:3186430-Pleurochrysis_carterae.AAC.1